MHTIEDLIRDIQTKIDALEYVKKIVKGIVEVGEAVEDKVETYSDDDGEILVGDLVRRYDQVYEVTDANLDKTTLFLDGYGWVCSDDVQKVVKP